jgi:peptidoglycan/LPS O-acetylase OafA/YrhL
MMVVVYHVLLGASIAAGTPMRAAYGAVLGTLGAHLNAGLYVFFALTGYFVGGPFVRAWMSGMPAPAAGAYLERRARRIIPAFWLFAAISIVVLHPDHNSAADLASVFGFAQTWHRSLAASTIVQAWTLNVEVAFYLALPLLALALRRRRIPAPVMLGAIVLAGAASLAVTPRYPVLTHASSMSLPAVLWAFVPGLALAAAEPFVAPRLTGPRGRLAGPALLAVSIGGFALVCHISTARTIPHLLALTLFAGGLVAAALTWQWSTGGAPRWAVNRVTNALGRWSYGIYLCHFVLSIKLIQLAPAGASAERIALFAGPIVIAASVAVAAVSWRFLERPILGWRSARVAAPAPAAVA